jgi:hypothetical protein
VESFESLRKAGCKLKASVSHAMRVYWLANHTAGASWDTVVQLCFREEWDRRMAAVTDGYTPLLSWDDKVASAMRAIKQDRHITKDGVPIGPVCPRLARKVGAHGGTPGGRDSGASRGSGSGRGGSGKGRGGSSRGRGHRRDAGSKENRGGNARGGAAAHHENQH